MDTHLLHNPFIRSLITIVVAVLIQMLLGRVIERLVRRLVPPSRFETKVDEIKREDTLITVLRTLLNVILWVITFLVVLSTLGVNLAALATGAGVFGVVIGFGAQSTIKDLLAGLFILAENQYRVGDIVTLAGGTTGLGTSGVVEEITLRVTKLRDLDGTLNVVRNGDASVITNRTFKYSSVVLDVTLSYDSDIDIVEKAMNDVGLDLAGDDRFKKRTVEPIQFLRVESFTTEGVTARAVGKVAPAAQWDTAGEYRRRLLKTFKIQGIQLSYAQVVVHNAAKTK